MQKELRSDLQRLGLASAEADLYLRLLSEGALSAAALASATGLQRTAVYPVLDSLRQKGLVESGEGYGSRFSAARPDKAFSLLVAREREAISQRARLAEEELVERSRLADAVAQKLKSIGEPSGFNGASELVQVIRDPRVVQERVGRLQQEAKEQIDVFTKPPYFARTNPGEQQSLRRGLQVRSLYERSGLNDPLVASNLAQWMAAGEQARVIEQELPHKLAIFDRQTVVMPLPLGSDQMRTLIIRHPQLAKSLGLAFEFLWSQAKPIDALKAGFPERQGSKFKNQPRKKERK
jgi:sugar-specific transcriptional regulator TrmB